MRAEFSADQAGFFAERGFGDLGEPLMAEALTNVVSGFPPEVAEHFSEFTVAASPLPSDPDAVDVDIDLARAFDLLASTPDWPETETGSDQSDAATPTGAHDPDTDGSADDAADETVDDFGSGAGTVDQGAADGPVDQGAADAAGSDTVATGSVGQADHQIAGAGDPLDELSVETSVEPTSIEEVDPMGLDEADGVAADGDSIDG